MRLLFYVAIIAYVKANDGEITEGLTLTLILFYAIILDIYYALMTLNKR